MYKMPSWVENESKWNKAKRLAEEEGHKEDYDYITAIYTNLIGEKVNTKGPLDLIK